jgi:hypothetical protein
MCGAAFFSTRNLLSSIHQARTRGGGLSSPTLLQVALAVASVFAALEATSATGTVYYVDGACPTSGTGARLGCGARGPFRTIGEGIDAMHAGDTLSIRGPHDAFDGVYREGVYLTNTRPSGIRHGHALDCRTNPCTLQGYNGERPVVQGARVHSDWVADGGGVYHRTMEAAPEDAGAEDSNHLRPDANGPRDPYNLFTNHPPAGADAPEGNVELPYSLNGDNDTSPAAGYWSYDTATQTVYVHPPGGDDPATTILVPFLYNAFLLAAPTANVTVQDLDFGWTRMMAADVGRGDARATKPNLVFRRDHFKHYRQKGMIGHLDTNILVEDCTFEYCGRGLSFNTGSGDTCYGMRLFGATGGTIRKTTGWGQEPITYRYLGAAGSWRFSGNSQSGGPNTGFGALRYSWGDAPWTNAAYTYAATRGHGFDLKQTNGNATHDVGSGFTVDHLEAQQVQEEVLFIDTTTDALLDGAYLHECGQAWVMSNYTPQAPALYGSNLVVRNSFFLNTGGARNDLSTSYICGTDRSERQPGEEGLPLAQVYNNFYVNSGWSALTIAGNSGNDGHCANQTTDPDYVVIDHNSFTGSWTNADAQCGAGGGCRQVVFRDVCAPGANCTHGVVFTNNIVDHPSDEALVFTASGLGNTTLDYNLYGSATACPSCNGVACDGTNILFREAATMPSMGVSGAPSVGTCETLASFQGAHGTQEVHGFAGAPGFVSPTDPHLTLASAAIDRGSPGGPPTDIDGQPRDAHPDIGADEYSSTLPTIDRCLSGTELMLVAPRGRSARRRLLAQSNDRSQLVLGDGADNTTLIAQGGSLTVRAVGGDGFDTTYPLPAADWRLLRKRNPRYGIRYRDRKGPIDTVIFKAGRLLKVAGAGPQLVQSLRSEPVMVEVDLQIAQYRYHLAFGTQGRHRFKANERLVRRSAPRPGLCSAAPGVVARDAVVP